MNDKLDRCISYIYNEMDPSEQVEFERELEHNENLLIEVESLKKASGRLQNIQLMDPPAELVENIYQQASRTNASVNRSQNWWKWGSAAAVLLISVSMSSYMLLPVAESDDMPEGEENVLMGAPSAPNWSVEQEEITGGDMVEQEAPAAQLQAQPPTPTAAISAPAEQNGSPWVDNNDILHFQDRILPANASQIDSIRTQSLKKLTPVEDSRERARIQHRLHLTGSNR